MTVYDREWWLRTSMKLALKKNTKSQPCYSIYGKASVLKLLYIRNLKRVKALVEELLIDIAENQTILESPVSRKLLVSIFDHFRRTWRRRLGADGGVRSLRSRIVFGGAYGEKVVHFHRRRRAAAGRRIRRCRCDDSLLLLLQLKRRQRN